MTKRIILLSLAIIFFLSGCWIYHEAISTTYCLTGGPWCGALASPR